MGPKKDRSSRAIQGIFEKLNDDKVDEILEAYNVTLDGEDDFHLSKVPTLLEYLNIPGCFTEDINECIDYYYTMMHSRDLSAGSLNSKLEIVFSFLEAYTITSAEEIGKMQYIDIVDIDKLINNVDKLLKFRDNYEYIYDSWKLVTDAVADTPLDTSQTLSYHLTLPDLKKLKKKLNLDSQSQTEHSLGDGFLIDMLSCCTSTSSGRLINFDFEKARKGPYVGTKDFAEILGNLNELAT
ncbi:Piso0_002060 [Millerozyma farinosa CBS 7064]|uniref:Piso0_002060 protein n=1 Tax=Pichia sorbitophila (strain ATCC MYA-4447 / BCRC 22081 / CBS 7064 / NBRC 10061 / NRRL Y-12695) TaxID=559304 RepID=G8YBK8_PICSO|nr:Piso0_002060 [Millerozyma farinosa CBS 7064]